MAFVRLFDNPEGTQEQYDAATQAINIDESNLPEGSVLHVAGPSPTGGWRVVEVWESEDPARKIDEEQLMTVLQQVGVARPVPQVWHVPNLIRHTGVRGRRQGM